MPQRPKRGSIGETWLLLEVVVNRVLGDVWAEVVLGGVKMSDNPGRYIAWFVVFEINANQSIDILLGFLTTLNNFLSIE